MTMKDFLTAVIAASVSDEVTAFATAEVAKIDGKNAKRRTTPTAAQKANADMLTAFVASLRASEWVTASDAASRMGVTVQKASALLQSGVKSGALVVTDAKVKGKGKVKAYAVIPVTAEDADAEVSTE